MVVVIGSRLRLTEVTDSKRIWANTNSRSLATRKVSHDPRFPGVLIQEAVSGNA